GISFYSEIHIRRLYMAYIIGIILGIIVLIIIGLFMRKRIYDEVDRQENWKVDIMDRNVATEISRIKKLNLSGETQEKFESWKQRWEYIVEKKLTDVEEYLFDAEESADRYRFPSAKKAIQKTDNALQSIEKEIKEILSELNELMDSEETSRKKIEEIGPSIKALKKTLMQNRYQYGEAVIRFEENLDTLENLLIRYNELTEDGNYIEASQLANSLQLDLEELEEQIEEFPTLLSLCKTELPKQLDEILQGIKEMKEDGFRVEHLGFEKEIRIYQQRLLDNLNELEKNNMEEPKKLINELEERINEMYLLLEKEAIAKNYVVSQYSNYMDQVAGAITDFEETKSEVEQLKQSYYFDDRDLEKYLAIEKAINRLNNEKEEMDAHLNEKNTAHTEIRSSLEKSFERVKEIEEELSSFRLSIQNLRKDELEAKEKLSSLREQINTTNRRIQKSNIPGVPQFIWEAMMEAQEKTDKVLSAIETQPLDMRKVQHALEETKSAVDHLIEQTDMMLDQAYLTEQVIQYANRYRSQIPELAAELADAEKMFRNYEYELALEKAAKAIENVEPGALKKIEEYQSAVVTN